jgi:hypothetical protein
MGWIRDGRKLLTILSLQSCSGFSTNRLDNSPTERDTFVGEQKANTL